MVNAVKLEQVKLFLINKESIELPKENELFTKIIKNSSEEEQYDKFYSLWAFDEIGYHKHLKKVFKERNIRGAYDLSLEERKKLREKFYVLDDFGEKIILGDQKHIFRSHLLWRILSEIYAQFAMKYALYEDVTNIDGLLFYQEELQCEIDGFQMKSLKVRVLAHLELLRLLKKGYDIKESVKRVRKEFLK